MNWNRPTFEHQHFVAIAKIIHTIPDESQREFVMMHFIARLATSNPKFDAARFQAVCDGKPISGRDK